MRNCLWILLLGVMACGSDGGGGSGGTDASSPDSETSMVDAATDAAPAPAMITLTGTATATSLQGPQPVAAATIAAYASTDEATPVATTMTDTAGNFTLVLTTGGVALDGFLKATKAGHVVTYLYAPAPISMDMAMVPINMLTTGNYGTLYTFTQTTEAATAGTIALIVHDAAAMPVAGATVTSTPAGTYKYNGSNGFPSSTATSTAADGTAYILNAPLGAVTVMASKTGSTFASNAVKSFDGALTTTLIEP